MTQCAKIIVGFMANVGNVFYPTFTTGFFVFSTFLRFLTFFSSQRVAFIYGFFVGRCNMNYSYEVRKRALKTWRETLFGIGGGRQRGVSQHSCTASVDNWLSLRGDMMCAGGEQIESEGKERTDGRTQASRSSDCHWTSTTRSADDDDDNDGVITRRTTKRRRMNEWMNDAADNYDNYKKKKKECFYWWYCCCCSWWWWWWW